MDNFHDFHSSDYKIANYCFSRSQYVDNRENHGWMPFLSFPITKSCNFRCIYCGIGGEATASLNKHISLSIIIPIVEKAVALGVTKFRITGGEPFLHPQIIDILQWFSDHGYYTLVNTNGSLITKYSEELSRMRKNLRFAVSLDTLQPEKFAEISCNDCLHNVLSGIECLSQLGLLLRCNMVVGKRNIDEVYPMISFCQSHSCDLKLLDIVSVPLPYGERSDFYQEVISLERQLKQDCDEVYTHEYSRSFGTPCYRYRFGNTYVTVKNSRVGSHYDMTSNGICKKCKYFPCHEGLYDIFALSDGRLCSCRWTENQTHEEIDRQLKFLIDTFLQSEYYSKGTQFDMCQRTDLKTIY